MQDAETVLAVLRERGRKGLPLDELYRQLFNPQLYLLAYGRIKRLGRPRGPSQQRRRGILPPVRRAPTHTRWTRGREIRRRR